ncbi:PIN domain-like protein [Mycena metata]|uniref:PIN domain-like protein n=1 Tax=Mycena metata TaxID=1033252 RepID=A0AAD7MSQ6_9AGAR|nr:PIN domain-like protein [Mycena metata]
MSVISNLSQIIVLRQGSFLLVLLLDHNMGAPKLWQILSPAAQNRSLLHLATTEGFQIDRRRQRTFIVGIDISIKIEAFVATLTAAHVYHPGRAGQKLVLEKLYYYLHNLCLAPATYVCCFDGDGRPAVKRGTRGIHRPTPLVEDLKTMIKSFGFFVHEAPGEAEAELAQLNANGTIDAILTEDSDAFVFGALCVIRTVGPSVEEESLVYTLESIAKLGLDTDGMFLCALLLGGDYGAGLQGAGPTIAQALAAQGFGRSLARILTSFDGFELNKRLASWRQDLRQELRTNSSGQLDKRQPMLASNIPDDFPNVAVARLYLRPLTSMSPGFTGRLPDSSSWKTTSPNIAELSRFCSTHFGWTGEDLLKKLNSNLWPGIAFKLISSPHVLYDHRTKRFASPYTNATLLKVIKHSSTTGFDVHRVRVSTDNFVALAQLDSVGVPAEIKLISVPQAILAVAMRDLAQDLEDSQHEGEKSTGDSTSNLDDATASGAAINVTNSNNGNLIIDISDSDEEEQSTTGVIDVSGSDDEDFISAHRALAAGGLVDLSDL